MKYIAEIGSNWKVNWKTKENNGENWIELKKLVIELAKNGADFIKFQAWNTPKFIHPEHPDYNRYEEFELPVAWYQDLIDLCSEWDVKFMATAFDEGTADTLHKLGQKYWKIASGDITHLKLIEHIAKYNQEMFISTGNANMYEIGKAVDTIRKHNLKPLTILHCVSNYPTKLSEIGFNQLKILNYKYGLNCNIGWSSHVTFPDSLMAAASAKALGANTIEVHVLSSVSDSPDSDISMNPIQFKSFVNDINSIDLNDPIINEHELLWSRRGVDGLRPWINWEVRN